MHHEAAAVTTVHHDDEWKCAELYQKFKKERPQST